MKIIQKGIELTKAKLRAPYFPDNCNISSLRKKPKFQPFYNHCVLNYHDL